MKVWDAKHVAVLVILICCVTVSAIKPLEDNPPADLPEGAEAEDVEEMVEIVNVTVKETDLVVERLHAGEAEVGDEIEVTLRVDNRGDDDVRVVVSEKHRWEVDYIDPLEVRVFHYEAKEIPYYRWDIRVPAKGSAQVSYHIKTRDVGMVTFPAAVVGDGLGNSFTSKPSNLKVVCRPDGRCDSGENYIYCPQDCTTGVSDGSCDGVADGRCDPDCAKGADPDCAGDVDLGDEGVSQAGEGVDSPVLYLVAVLFLIFLLGLLARRLL